jgi:hypothetical protein
MIVNKYIGGNFARNDSPLLNSNPIVDFFPNLIGDHKRFFLETGVDALAFIVNTKKEINTIYFPLHYCEETIQRFMLKCKNKVIKRYDQIMPLSCSNAFFVWNHFNNYTPLPQKIKENNSLFIIEDFVQCVFNLQQFIGFAAFTSLRKWSEIDCSIVYLNTETDVFESSSSQSNYYKLKKKAEKIKESWKLQPSKIHELEYLELFKSAEIELNVSNINYSQPDQIMLTQKIDWNLIKKIRVENAHFLITELKELNIKILTGDTFFVMILVKNRKKIKHKLAEQGVFAPVHWLDSSDELLRDNLLSLPIDQRYCIDDMKRITGIIKNNVKIRTV